LRVAEALQARQRRPRQRRPSCCVPRGYARTPPW